MTRRTRRTMAILAAAAAFGAGTVPSASAATEWQPFGVVEGTTGPFESRIDIGSITFVNPERMRVRVFSEAPRAKVYLEGECRRPDGSWSKRRKQVEVVKMPYTENVTALLKPSKFEYCWMWVTVFPRTKANQPVTTSILMEATYSDG